MLYACSLCWQVVILIVFFNINRISEILHDMVKLSYLKVHPGPALRFRGPKQVLKMGPLSICIYMNYSI